MRYYSWPEGTTRETMKLLQQVKSPFTEKEAEDICGMYYRDAIDTLMALRVVSSHIGERVALIDDKKEIDRIIQHLHDDLEELELARKVNMAQVSAAESADRSAKAAERSARAAEKSIRLSVISIVVSMLSLVAALAAILFS